MSVVGSKKYRFKDLPKGQRLEYYWMYYKFHVFFGLVAAFLVGYTLYGILLPKPDLQVIWMSDRYSRPCENELRATLKALDWDTNGDGKTGVMLTYVEFERNYHELPYSAKSEITVLVAGQEYSFFLVNEFAKDWMLENDLAAKWNDLGIGGASAQEHIFVPLSQIKAFSGEFSQPLDGLYLSVAQVVEGKEAEYERQADALRRFLIEQKAVPQP